MVGIFIPGGRNGAAQVGRVLPQAGRASRQNRLTSAMGKLMPHAAAEAARTRLPIASSQRRALRPSTAKNPKVSSSETK